MQLLDKKWCVIDVYRPQILQLHAENHWTKEFYEIISQTCDINSWICKGQGVNKKNCPSPAFWSMLLNIGIVGILKPVFEKTQILSTKAQNMGIMRSCGDSSNYVKYQM